MDAILTPHPPPYTNTHTHTKKAFIYISHLKLQHFIEYINHQGQLFLSSVFCMNKHRGNRRLGDELRKLALNVKHHNVSGCIYRMTYVHLISRPVPKCIETKTKIVAIPQMTCWNAFSWMMYKNVDKNSLMFLSRSPIDNFRHWFR